jgi:hypothetical protein
MAKLVSIQETVYKLSVNSGGTITLNTGNQVGSVIVTGDLTVLGNSTSVQTANMEIEDNILLLNRGELNAGITERTAGIEIDRGGLANVQFLFDEDLNWRDSQTATTKSGVFVLRDADTDRLIGLQTNSITTSGFDLNLLGTGTARVDVVGTVDYERQVLDYTLPGYPAKDDDIIPNIKAVTDYVTEYFNVNPPFKIQDSEIIEGVTYSYDSLLEVHDSESDGGDSNLTLTLDGIVSAEWYAAYHNVQDIRIAGSTITGLGDVNDLVLTNPGTGSVTIDDNLKITIAGTAPAVADDGIKVYANAEGQGGTGIYFVNTKSTTESITTRDELISRRKALAYSMIF